MYNRRDLKHSQLILHRRVMQRYSEASTEAKDTVQLIRFRTARMQVVPYNDALAQ